jgi:hypothetical protein
MFLQIATDDASLLGWLTVALYFLSAVLSGVIVLRAKYIFDDPYLCQHRLVWNIVTAAMGFLGLNKQLDLQTAFSHFIERLGGVEIHGGEEPIRLLLVAGFGLLGVTASLGLLWFMRSVWQQYWLLGVAGLLLALFIVKRTSVFYGVDLPILFGGLQFDWLLEILAAVVIAVAAATNLRRGTQNMDVV